MLLALESQTRQSPGRPPGLWPLDRGMTLSTYEAF
jgi:hypothetical protein